MLAVQCSVSSGISARSCERLQRRNISRPCGESDTNLWMSQGSDPLGCFIWQNYKNGKNRENCRISNLDFSRGLKSLSDW